MPSAPMLSSPPSDSANKNDPIYETMFDPFNTGLTSPFGQQNQQTSQFNSQMSPSSSTNLNLENLVLGDSPTATFNAPRSQGTQSPPFGDFDAAMANFNKGYNSGMPIETMLDVTPLGEPSYFAGSNVVTEQTARLMRHYIDNLASWMDLSDSRAHFSTVLPKRALTSVSHHYFYLILANIIECTVVFFG